MNNNTTLLPCTTLLLIILIYSIKPAIAFYEKQKDNNFIDARGLIRANANALKYPNDSPLYQNTTESGVAAFARLMIDGGFNQNWGVEFNAYQTYIPEGIQIAQSNSGIPTSTERSAILEKSFSNSDYVRLAVDRLAIRWTDKRMNLIVGRQAINLATTFYFTPNDFFAPFAAQTFYRVFKQGVDALRIQYGISELSQLSYMGVLGYAEDLNSVTGWEDSPDSSRTSHLIRWSDVFHNFEAILLLGDIVDKNVIGGAIQGELISGIGMRVEGHYGNPQKNDTEDYTQVSVGFEYQWQNNSELRLELFYNGLGANDVSQYQLIQSTSNVQYFARRYTALGGSYNITPLLTGQAVIISNLDDQSHLLSLYTVYSLSNESEITLSLNIPFGEAPDGLVFKSEFGTYPKSISLEFRQYF
ncbi:MAG: hypothetical protein ACC657_08935 [Thiohalomonadales bacterium]